MWIISGSNKVEGIRLKTSLRSVRGVIRWFAGRADGGVSAGGELRGLDTVKALQKKPQLLARFDPSLIRNFRWVKQVENNIVVCRRSWC